MSRSTSTTKHIQSNGSSSSSAHRVRTPNSAAGDRDKQSTPLKLPPMLSPSLPAWVNDRMPDIPDRMLSPTLPPAFDDVNNTINNNKARKKEGRERENPPLHHPVPRRAAGKQLSKVFDNDSGRDSDSSAAPSPVPPSVPGSLPAKPTKRRPTFMVSLKMSPEVHKRLGPSGKERKSGASSTALTGLGIKNEQSKRKSVPMEKVGSKKPRVSRSYSSSSDDSEVPLKTQAKKVRSALSTPTTPKAAAAAGTAAAGASQTSTPKLKPSAQITSKRDHSNTTTNTNDDTKTTTINKANSSSTPRLGTSSSSNTADSEERKAQLDNLNLKVKGWVGKAQSLKHEADRQVKEAKYERAGALMLDSAFAFIVGFDYEDKASMITRGSGRTQSWVSMISFLGQCSKILDQAVDSRLMCGLCYQLRGVVQIRLANITQRYIRRSANETNDAEKAANLTNLVQQYTQHLESATHDFKRGNVELSADSLRREFPKTWKSRDSSGQRVKDSGLRPKSDAYFLPLHIYSTVQDAVAFGCAAASEWAQKNQIDYQFCTPPDT